MQYECKVCNKTLTMFNVNLRVFLAWTNYFMLDAFCSHLNLIYMLCGKEDDSIHVRGRAFLA